MANQQPIELQEEIREGTFEWRIGNFLEQIDEMQSPCFRLGKDTCFLGIPERNKTCASCLPRYSVHVYSTVKLQFSLFSSETFYKESLIDRDGREFISKGGIISQKYIFSAFCFHRLYLEEHSDVLLPEGSLTIRLSWYVAKKQDGKTKPDSTSVEDSPKFLETLSKDFQCFYESQTGTNCVLRVGNAQISAHRQVLSARSTVFAAMFRQDTSENRNGVVDILDVDATVLGDVIHYVYTGQVRGITSDTAAPMYKVADKYALIELRDFCLEFLMRSLTIENVCDAAIVAHRHAESMLEEKVVQFMDEKLEELEETDEWTQFSKSEPLLSVKFLRSAYHSCRKWQNLLTKLNNLV